MKNVTRNTNVKAFLVILSPAIIVHFSMVSAKKEMNEIASEKPSNPMLPENNYGRGQKEASEYEKLKKLRTQLFFACSVAGVVVVFFTSILPI